MHDLESRVAAIEERNVAVTCDKAWEGSKTRKILLVLFTYLAVGVYLYLINIPNPWLNAIVPAAAFSISTLSLPIFKRLWLKYIIPSRAAGTHLPK